MPLFDLAIPGMASPVSLAAVRECHPNVITAVVSCSVRREDVFPALRAEIQGFIPKGSSIEALNEALRMIRGGFFFVPSFVTRIDIEPPCVTRGTASVRDSVDCITSRQRQVLELIAAGRSNKKIARIL